MGIRMDEALSQMSLSLLADRCANELKRHRRKEPADDRFCLEIFYRAIIQRMDQAWSVLQQRFSEIVRIWLHSHPSSDVALLRDTEENYVAQTFSRFWYAVRDQRLEFATLNAALSYLHATLNGIVTDTLRSRLRSKEVPLPEPGFAEEPVVEDPIDGHTIWDSIQSFLPDAVGAYKGSCSLQGDATGSAARLRYKLTDFILTTSCLIGYPSSEELLSLFVMLYLLSSVSL